MLAEPRAIKNREYGLISIANVSLGSVIPSLRVRKGGCDDRNWTASTGAKMRRMNARSRPGHADAKRFAVRKSRGEMKPDSKEFDSMSNRNCLRSSTKPLPSYRWFN